MRRLVAVSVAFVLLASACSDDDEPAGATTIAAATSTVPPSGPGTSTTASDAPSTATTSPPTAAPTTAGTVPATSTTPSSAAPTTAVGDAGPYAPGAEWAVESPADHDIDEAELTKSREYAFAEGMHTQGVVVVHRGAIVAEWYDTANGENEDSWAASWSMGKSFASALIGIAIDEGLIPSVDEPMSTYYPKWKGTPRADITLGDVLQMASGLDWDENYDPSDITASEVIQMGLSANELRYAAQRPAEVEPGTRFNYSSGDSMLLSGVIEKATGMTMREYAELKLFEPLGLDQIDWWEDADGHTLTYCCVDTTSRDFARFGLLYLRGGRWGTEQVVPEAWVADSVEPSPSFEGYGYQWWLTGNGEPRLPDDTFSARGHNGQFIYVIPSLDLVAVRNGSYTKYDGEPVADPNLFGKYPPDNLVPGQGTRSPEAGWDDVEFLAPIVASLGDDA